MSFLYPTTVADWDERDELVDTDSFRMASITEIRHSFATTPFNQIVTADVYITRLTGHERLVRADEPGANLLGLLDEDTGNRILVPAEEFARVTQSHRVLSN